MAVPAFLLAVDREIDGAVRIFCPLLLNLLALDEVFLRAGTVNDIEVTVVLRVGSAVIDDGTERSKTDAAGDKDEVFAAEIRVDWEAVAIRAADQNLLSLFHVVQPAREMSAFLDGELIVIRVLRRRCD